MMGAGTLECTSLPQGAAVTLEFLDRRFAARLVAAAWLLEEEPQAAPAEDWGSAADLPVTGPGYEALLALPDDEQRVRVAALRAAELACDGSDLMEILTGDGRP